MMTDFLLRYRDLATFFWPSLVTGLAAAVAGGVLGVFVLLRREAMVALALPQVAVAGAAAGLAVLDGVALPPAMAWVAAHAGWPTLPPAVVAVAAALGGLAISRRGRGGGGWLLPCLFVGAMSVSFLLVARHGQHVADLQNRFTGIDVAVDLHTAEVTAPALLACAAVAAALWRRWALLAQAPAAAALAGLRPARWEAAFLTLLAVVVLLGTNALGAVLVLATLFLPAAAVLPWARRVPGAVCGAAIVAITLYAVGFVLSNEQALPLGHSVGGIGLVVAVGSHVLAAVAPRDLHNGRPSTQV